MTEAHLLSTIRATFMQTPALQAFCGFPDDVMPQPVQRHYIGAEDGFLSDHTLGSAPLVSAIRDFAPKAHWRETYKGTDIGDEFLNRFCCFNLIGAGGPFLSKQLWAWMVYMPAHLHYPWHHHPGEEMYLVLSGQARFFREGETPEILQSGACSAHASNQPHAMETEDHSVLALVVWRNGFDTPPQLTKRVVHA